LKKLKIILKINYKNMDKFKAYKDFENFDWTKQEIKSRTRVLRSQKKEEKSFFDHLRSLLF